MGRLLRGKINVQKTDVENNSPTESNKKTRRNKICKNVKIIETESVSEAGPSSKVNNKQENKDYKPIYISQKKSLTRKSLKDIQDRLQLYDFEVDESEPVVKKAKRKPILKIKKHRTYKKKFKFLPESSIDLEAVGKENAYTNKKTHIPSKKASTPLAEISNIPIVDNLDLSIDVPVTSRKVTLYSPQPYRSPKRDSHSVSVLRTSDCNAPNINVSSRSLNTTAGSSKHDRTNFSAYSGVFLNDLFIGSSTPIRSHWAEDPSLARSATHYGNFDLSNNFGFEADNSIDEPFVSPIKTSETPLKSVPPKSPKSRSPYKVPFKRVMKMLKFGWDAPDSDGELSFEGLPNDFYHDGNSPSFSLPSNPSTPECSRQIPLNDCISNKKKKKKKLNFKADLDDSGNLTQSSEDKENQEKIVYKNKRKNLKILKEENDKGYETGDQISTKRQVRRSYERPSYLRPKKKANPYDLDDDEEDDCDDTVSVKTNKKKPGGLSKKEEMEMEKWAKAFNEQCMQVENFNLCVE